MNTVLGIEHFFYVSDRTYDLLAERALPRYHDAHKALVAAVTVSRQAPLRMLDLGTGSGVTSAYLLENFHRSSVVGVDLFEEMLADAGPRLGRFGSRVTLVRSDNGDFLRSCADSFDVIVSAFCLHHLLPGEKQELFRLVMQRLAAGGLFLMLDITTFSDRALARAARERTIAHMQSQVADEAYRREWIHHWNEINVPDPSDVMVMWLREIGFRTETVFRDFEIAVIRAQKPEEALHVADVL